MREVDDRDKVYQNISAYEDDLVWEFADHMRERLVANQHKTPWVDESPAVLFPRLLAKVDNIKRKYENEGKFSISDLADAANYAAMIADLVE